MRPPPKSMLYEPLLPHAHVDDKGYDDEEEEEGKDTAHPNETKYLLPARKLMTKRASIPVWTIGVVAFMQLVTLFVLFLLLAKVKVKAKDKHAFVHGNGNGNGNGNTQVLYSPVEDIVEYEVVKFRSGLNGEGDDMYTMPPSEKVDAAWEDLYNFGISELTEQQALKLANTTMRVPNSDNKYIMLLDVFHELHCINMIRKALYPQHYYNTTNAMASTTRRTHLTHCLNSLRQSVQCSADISTIVWRKPEHEHDSKPESSSSSPREGPRFDIVHSCRNFGKIREWAAENRGSIYVKDGRISATPDGFGHGTGMDIDMDREIEMGMGHHHHHHDGT